MAELIVDLLALDFSLIIVFLFYLQWDKFKENAVSWDKLAQREIDNRRTYKEFYQIIKLKLRK